MICISRAPHGARGLKFTYNDLLEIGEKSRPTRGAWIEIKRILSGAPEIWSRPTRGAWIEIMSLLSQAMEARARRLARPPRGAGKEIRSPRFFWRGWSRRAPHGARGLKSVQRLPGSSPTPPKKPQTPLTANAVRGVRYQRKACSAKRTNRKRAAAVAQRRKRYHERSKQNLWDRALPNEGVFSA